MTMNLIRNAALQHFIQKGYEGTSLSDIAEEVGIKKQSIYTHYKNKDELFLTVMNHVISEETKFLHQFFLKPDPGLQLYLQKFVFELQNHYISSDESNMKFVLRMAYMPPLHLKAAVIDSFNQYFLDLEELIKTQFVNNKELSVKADMAALSFMTMLDGLLVALVYGGATRFNKKLDASWKIYWNGLLCS